MTIQQVLAGLIATLTATGIVFAQGADIPDPGLPETDDIPSSLMTFFVTSEPIGDGGTQERPGQPAVNARDRIGDGPWYHSRARILDYLNRRMNRPFIKSQIHGDTLLEAQRGSNMFKQFALTEHGEIVNGIGDPLPTRHALLTGSQTDGRAFPPGEDRTCNNWTSNGEGAAQFGHSDRIGLGNQSWNSAGTTTGCSQDDLVSWGGVGLFYCFAID